MRWFVLTLHENNLFGQEQTIPIEKVARDIGRSIAAILDFSQASHKQAFGAFVKNVREIFKQPNVQTIRHDSTTSRALRLIRV